MPKIVLTTEELPEIADWKNGENYSVTLELKQLRGGADKKSFEIVSAMSGDGAEEADEPPVKGHASNGDGMMEPQEIMANGGSPKRKMVMKRMQEKAQSY